MVDTVVVASATETKEDPKHIEAMVAKVDAAEAAAKQSDAPDISTEADQRPGWLPEKFKTPEDLAKAYAELEGKLGGAKEKSEGSTEASTNSTEQSTQEQAKEAVESTGLSFDEFSKEFAENGGLTDESYQKLEKAGIPKAIVDQYIAGQQAMASRMEAEVKAVVGGQEQFQELVAWAVEHADPKAVEAYNRAVDSGDLDQAKLALAGLNHQFREANPQEPTLVQGTNGRVSSDVYESIAQMRADMSKPEYKNDPAFRKKVQEKLGRSNIL